ncbi:hypothetical protein Pan241w_28630 [Gimesia alba]|uniref:Uncharacterized protein n=1 Tax=Gimesia alba TaxID=2527973 RepID=A0A517RFX5_9PLAN|nr:hypothetical protein [Gimesia alba]QDT42774.1 hypothetical protein Pan241w_28630 [Gimesia alba]
MVAPSPLIEVPATPEYVLAVLREKSRQEWGKAYCQPPKVVPLTLDSPVEMLYEACDLIDDMNIYFYPMEWFGFEYVEWRDALGCREIKTARDFCEVIASLISLPRIPLVSFCGKPCQPASVFLTVRSLLQDAGVDVKQIAPSTPLKEFTRHYTETFLGPIARLAPGSLPDVEIDEGSKFLRQFIRDIWGIPVLLAYFYTFFHPDSYPGLFGCMVSIYLFLILITVGDEKAPPVDVEFGDLRTFRDLSNLLASRAVFQS